MVGMRHPWNRTNCIKIFHSFLPMLLGFSIFAGLLVSGTNTGARYVPGTPDCTWVQHTSRCHSSAIEVSVFLLFFFCFRDEEVRGWRTEEERLWNMSKVWILNNHREKKKNMIVSSIDFWWRWRVSSTGKKNRKDELEGK